MRREQTPAPAEVDEFDEAMRVFKESFVNAAVVTASIREGPVVLLKELSGVLRQAAAVLPADDRSAAELLRIAAEKIEATLADSIVAHAGGINTGPGDNGPTTTESAERS